MDDIDLQHTRDALHSVYGLVTETVSALTDRELLASTRCAGWMVADVLFHLLLDAQRALVTLASPAPGPPTVDHVTYWAQFKPGGDDALSHARFVRASAAAYARPSGIAAHWRSTAEAAVRAAQRAQDRHVTTQGHVLSTSEFLATLVVEAVVHYLDLSVGLLAAGRVAPTPMAITHATLDGLLARPVRAPWDDVTYVLKGTGRLALSLADRGALSEAAALFPLLG